MNIVFACHEIGGRKFCFSVPEAMVQHISKGTILYVETMKGPALAYAASAPISGPGAEDLAKESGAYFPLKEVISFVPFAAQEQIEDAAIEGFKKRLHDILTVHEPIELPF